MGKPLKKAVKPSFRKTREDYQYSVGPVKFDKIKDRIEGYGMVSLDEAERNGNFQKFNRSMLTPGTYFRVEKKTGRVRCLVTVMPTGLHVAWDTCGTCHSYFSVCRCSTGFSTERSVEFIYDKIVANQAGEEFDHNHPNYRGSLTKEARERRLGNQETRRIVTPARDVSQIPKKMAPAKKVLRKAAPEKPVQESAPKPKILRKGNDVSKVLTKGTLDIGKLNREATEVQRSAEDEFNQRVKKSIKKSVKKGTSK